MNFFTIDNNKVSSLLTNMSMLTDHGTLLSASKYNEHRDKLVITQYLKFSKKYKTHNQYRRVMLENARGILTPYYRIPRRALPIKIVSLDEPEKRIERNDGISIYDYQDNVIKDVMNGLKTDYSYFLQMGTGMGKSFVATELILRMRLRTCIVVPNKILALQMKDDIMKALKNAKGKMPFINVCVYDKKFMDAVARERDLEDGIMQDSTYRSPADICIVVINTAAKLNADFWQAFGLVILDEVHCYCTNTFVDVFWNADIVKYIVGMTATPERIDGLESISKIHLGPIHRAENIDESLSEDCSMFTGMVRRVNYYGPPMYTQQIKSSAGINSPVLMAKQLLEDPIRMELATKILLELYGAGHSVYVFCQTKEPLWKLKKKIIDTLTVINSVDEEDKMMELRELLEREIHVVTGDNTKDEIMAARSESKIFLTTYSLSNKGLSLPRFTALIFLTPMKSNMQQIIGRIFRMNSDYSIVRVIVDIVDMCTSLKSQHYERKKEYIRRRLPVTSEYYPKNRKSIDDEEEEIYDDEFAEYDEEE